MVATVILVVIIAVLLFFAVRRIVKKGSCDCSSCEAGCGNCSEAQKKKVHSQH